MQRIPVAVGLAAVAALLAAGLLLPARWSEGLRDLGSDLVLAADHRLRPAAKSSPSAPVVVDIDRRSLEAVGPWPWPRSTIAQLIDAIAAAGPAAVAVDILFAEHDARCPAAFAGRPAAASAACEPGATASSFTEGDKLLAQAAYRAPVILGFLLDPERVGSVPQVPLVTRGSPSFDGLWNAAGAVVPPSLLVAGASGLGALSLSANGDGVVRRVPLLVGVGGYVLPGLALESIRVSRSASTYLVQAAPPILATADVQIPMTSDALLRLTPVAPERRVARTISAIDVLEGRADLNRLAGALVLVGGSAPELGGLRETATDPLTPSVQIQADAIEQIGAGRFPRPVDGARVVQPLLVLALGIMALAAGVALPPLLGAFALVGVVLAAWAIAIGGFLLTDRLVDPLTPALAAAAVFAVASVTSFAVTHRRELFVRRRFEQHLAPAVVQRIIAQPRMVKLGGESREVTALFTDLEGFTAMMHRAGPEELVAVLDDYFEGVAALIVEHGGMVDKIVGDAVHALFNAPLDLDDHPRRAVECAIAIRSWAQRYRALATPAAIGFGRTRIGIETGWAVVGDVGLRSKLDYTAHGDAVNAAARLEAANKQFGSAICVGPTAAARCDAGIFRPLGTIVVRGRDEPMAVFEPWPSDAQPGWRRRYLLAIGLMDSDPARAAALFEQLAVERRSDLVVRRMAEQLSAASDHAA